MALTPQVTLVMIACVSLVFSFRCSIPLYARGFISSLVADPALVQPMAQVCGAGPHFLQKVLLQGAAHHEDGMVLQALFCWLKALEPLGKRPGPGFDACSALGAQQIPFRVVHELETEAFNG